MSKDRTLSTAIHILAVLGVHDPELVSSETLARGIRTNPGLIRRLLVKLSEAGLVVTTKGKNGGSRLARKASQITMEDVYMAVKDSPLFGSFDKDPFKACFISCKIGSVLENMYGDFENELKKKMKRTKLSQLMSDLN